MSAVNSNQKNHHGRAESAEFRKRGKEMVDYIADYMDTIHTRRVIPEVQPGYLRDMLPSKAPIDGDKWEDIMRDVEMAIMPGITHWQHPRFHAYFPAGNSYPSILGDMLSDAIGCVGFSWAASPACTELETIVLDWLAKAIGLPPIFWHEHGLGGGVIQGSASDCVLVSLLAARYQAIKCLKSQYPNVEEGVLLSKLVGYCSKLAHSCVEKAGMISLVKIRQLETDEHFALRGQTFQKAIEEDRRLGLVPFYACATLGTTAICSFDNLLELGLVCERENIWLHVDAAYAGSAFICPEYQHLLKGIEHANSFSLNPTKWMLVNFDCSALWVRDRKVLTSALTVDPLYLQHHHSDKALDFRHWGIPLSRRFRSLKLWFVMRVYGIKGLQNYIREHSKLAKRFESLLRKDSRFEILGKVTMGLVCFRLQGHNLRAQMLLRAINMSGKLHMVPALVNDSYVIRFAVCAQNANDDDIDYAWNVVAAMASDVLAEIDSTVESEVVAQIERIASLELVDEVCDEEAVAAMTPKYSPISGGSEEEDEVFLYDNNIPSIASIPNAYEELDKKKGSGQPKAYRRRNMLLKMVSDPRCYSPQLMRQLSVDRHRRDSESTSTFGRSSHQQPWPMTPEEGVLPEEMTDGNQEKVQWGRSPLSSADSDGLQDDSAPLGRDGGSSVAAPAVGKRFGGEEIAGVKEAEKRNVAHRLGKEAAKITPNGSIKK